MSSLLVCRMIKTSGFVRTTITAGGAARRVGRLWLVIGLPLTGMAFAPAAFAGGALPQCGQFVSGQGSIGGSSHGLVITQPGSTRGVIDWRSFSIGKENSVSFTQQSLIKSTI